MLGVGDGSRRLHLPACRSLRQFCKRGRATCWTLATVAGAVVPVCSGPGWLRTLCWIEHLFSGRLSSCNGCRPDLSESGRFRMMQGAGSGSFRTMRGGCLHGSGRGGQGDCRTGPRGWGRFGTGADPCACILGGLGRGAVSAPPPGVGRLRGMRGHRALSEGLGPTAERRAKRP